MLSRVSSQNIIVGLVGLCLFLIPIAVRVIPVHQDTLIGGWMWTMWQSKLYGDFDGFFLIKSYILYLLGMAITLLFLLLVRKKAIQIENDVILNAMYVFGIWIVISAYLSDFPAESFLGYRDRYEGVFVIIMYILVLTVTRYVVASPKNVYWLLVFATSGAIIVAVISLCQFYGYNPLQASSLGLLIKGADYKEIANFGNFTHSAYGTLYNPNYLSGYMSIVFFIPFVFYLNTSNKWIIGISLPILLLFWASLISSKSSSGTMAVGVGILIVVALRMLWKWYSWRKLAILLILMIVIVVGMDVYANGGMFNEFTSIFHYGVNVFQALINNTPEERVSFPSTETSSDIEYWNLLQKYYPHESPLDRLGSGRGFIWRNSLEMVYQKPIFGYGMETFAHHFPQGDLRKFNGLGQMKIIVDKPHNLYLQIAVGAGIPALLIFIIINLCVLLLIIKKIYEDYLHQKIDTLLITATLMIVAYLVQGVFNDSTIGVSILYWIFLGVLLAVLRWREANPVFTLDENDRLEEGCHGE
ncbi:hypothetical protein BHU72_12515 [Desulfuribacillus stibiiarsenatis]|uniref:O-antigen ligase-related domain-containing protein n=1 Tax=Desulfuribacillus stibiiarsenatis TaxID=1390249 RepID=A0A1E5L272_9FIRM|nr:O-antigen ligase family protein [Desulfuribacillus stibiiarsenatis]OEH84220.1 hypothetical protein BHU72_12515 [Desulfuribacillus stibiiarsenatis]